MKRNQKNVYQQKYESWNISDNNKIYIKDAQLIKNKNDPNTRVNMQYICGEQS